MPPSFLIDKSAFARLPRPAVERRVGPLLLAGQIACCGITVLEVLYSARRHADLVATREELGALPKAPVLQRDFDRAEGVMELLARRGRHRGPGLPDLLLAAVAEREALCVLHYDHDFDLIAEVTGQRCEWVVPRGSVA